MRKERHWIESAVVAVEVAVPWVGEGGREGGSERCLLKQTAVQPD